MMYGTMAIAMLIVTIFGEVTIARHNNYIREGIVVVIHASIIVDTTDNEDTSMG